jgi:hypothetical protein
MCQFQQPSSPKPVVSTPVAIDSAYGPLSNQWVFTFSEGKPSIRGQSMWVSCWTNSTTICSLPTRFCVFIDIIVSTMLRSRISCTYHSSLILQSVLQQVHTLFQSQFSTECDPLLPLSISSFVWFS